VFIWTQLGHAKDGAELAALPTVSSITTHMVVDNNLAQDNLPIASTAGVGETELESALRLTTA
jgi:hypothetical protein